MSDLDLRLDQAAIASLAETPEARAMLAEVGRSIAGAARAGAPHRTGAGAASITPALSNGDVTVSWDRAHHYMYFNEVGTRYISGRHFLSNALNYAHL